MVVDEKATASRPAQEPGRTGPASRTAQERRLARLPFMLPVIVGLMWLSTSAESQTLLPMLAEVQKEYGLSAAQSAWALSITGIATATTVCGLSRLADLYGLRRLLLVSLGFVVVGNVVCAAAPDAPVFLAGRVLVGITASTPVFYAIMRARSSDNSGVNASAGLMTASSGAGLALSFLIGGTVIAAGGSARGVLWIVTLLSLAVLALVWLFIPETDVRSRARLDYAGAVLLGATLACLVIALGKGNEWGWSAGSTLGLLAAGAVLAALWTGWQLRAASPMVDLRIVRRRSVWPAFLLCAFATMLGSTNTMIVSQFLKTPGVAGYGFGLAVMAAGLCLMPVGLLIMTGGIVMPRVIAAIGIRRSGVIGAVVLIAAFTWGIVARTHIWQLIVEMVLYGIGHAMCFTSGKSAYLRGARPGEQGMITGAQNSLALALMGAGPTIVTAIVTSSYIKGTPFPRETNFEYTWLFFIGVAVCMLGLSLYLKVTDTDQNLAPDAVVVRT